MSQLTRLVRSVCMPRDDSWADRLLPLQQEGFPVAVCWSAKSGCTTVLKWFLQHTGRLDAALAHSAWIHDYREQKLFQAPGYRWQCERLVEHGRNGTSIIKVIRDPAARAVSSFVHFLRYGSDTVHWPDAARVMQWKAAVNLENQHGISFRQFLLFVTTQRRHRRLPDPHFRLQYDERQDPRVDAFIRLENLAAGLRAVEERCGLPHVDVHKLSFSSHHNLATPDHAWPDNAADFIADHTTLDALGTPPAEAFLDPDTLLLIRTAYWDDYEAYGRYYETSASTLRM